jgi:hypothetical protein
VAAVFVQTTGSGVDVLVLLVALFVLLVLERTLGDWVADTLGSGPAALVFLAIAVAGLVYVNSRSGRALAGRFFASAEARGYRSVYFNFKGPDSASELPRLHVATPPAPDGGPPPSIEPAAAAVAAVADPVIPSAPSAESVPRRAATGVRITRLRPSADVAMVGQPITLSVDVAADDAGDLPAIEFTVDGRLIATAVPERGRAAATWSTRVPGQYNVRVRLPGSFGISNLSTTVTILPGPVAGAPRRRNIK